MRLSFVGHASILLQAGGLNILIDPVWSERASPVSFAGPRRVNAPGIAFDDLPPIEAVLVSHGHYDHLDTVTLAALATPHRPRVITPLGNDVAISAVDPSFSIETSDWRDEVALSRDVKIMLAPMRHWSARGITDRNKSLWASFVIDTPAGRVYHVGDSGYGDGIYFRAAREQYGPFRLAILPIGAYAPRWFMQENHMNPEEAVKALADCGAEYGLAHHFGTFQMADDGFEAPGACARCGAQDRRCTGRAVPQAETGRGLGALIFAVRCADLQCAGRSPYRRHERAAKPPLRQDERHRQRDRRPRSARGPGAGEPEEARAHRAPGAVPFDQIAGALSAEDAGHRGIRPNLSIPTAPKPAPAATACAASRRWRRTRIRQAAARLRDHDRARPRARSRTRVRSPSTWAGRASLGTRSRSPRNFATRA